jgi:hypothetical protein
MVQLRQTAIPGDQASWREEFYTGHLKVVNGVVETDNPKWIEELRYRGFSIIEEVEPETISSEEDYTTINQDGEPIQIEQEASKKRTPSRRRASEE